MKLDIKELIAERLNFAMNGGIKAFDELLEKHIEEGKDEFAIIQLNGLMEDFQKNGKYPDLKKYYVTGIYELGCIDHSKFYHSMMFVLFTFSRKKPKKVKICSVPKKNINGNSVYALKDDLSEYYKKLEMFINESKCSEKLNLLVNEIAYNEIRKDDFNVSLYSKKYLAMIKSIKRQKIVLLKNLVDLLFSEINSYKEAKAVLPSFFSYPLNEESLPLRYAHGIFLKKGDIIVCNYSYMTKTYLIADDPKEKLIPPSLSVVLRLKTGLVTPEYLSLYMQSEIYKTLSLPVMYGHCNVNRDLLGEIPVLLPNTEIPLEENKVLSQKYIDLFNEKYRPYLVKKAEYFANVQRPNKKVVREDAVLDEYLEGLKNAHKQELLNYINENLREMNVCVSGQAYNTAIVVTGSILEAVLTDWLSEIEGKNYFKEPFRIVNENGRNQPRYLSLNDAIVKIAKIMKKWNEKEKAIAIRELRNRVHARVFLEQNKKITKRECETVQKNLNSVIRSRYCDFDMG